MKPKEKRSKKNPSEMTLTKKKPCSNKTRKLIKRNKAKKKWSNKKAKSAFGSKSPDSLKKIRSEKIQNEDLELLGNSFDLSCEAECMNTSMDENNDNSNLNDLNDNGKNSDDSKGPINLNEDSDPEFECDEITRSDTSLDKGNVSFKETSFAEGSSRSRVWKFYSHRRIVVILNHPEKFTITDFVRVKVISGKISIFGWEMDEKSKFIEVYSTEKIGALQLETVSANKMWAKPGHLNHIRQQLENLLPKQYINDILADCHSFPSLVLMEINKFHVKQKFIQQYVPTAFYCVSEYDPDPDEMEIVASYDIVAENKISNCIRIPCNFQQVAQNVSSEICFTDMKGILSPRILVCGPQRCGKSTLLRYLMNHVLQTRDKVCYLDTDLGQSEFTPPGCISLTEVTEPLFGPSFTHLKEPLKSVFIGLVSVKEYPLVYRKKVEEVMDFYNSNCSNQILFINTIGYVTDIGAICLQHLINYIRPTVLIRLKPKGREADTEGKLTAPKNCKYINLRVQNIKMSLTSLFLRDLRMIAYMGQCQRSFESVKSFNALQPYCVPLNKLAIQDFPYHFSPDQLINSLNLSVVALCVVDNSVIIKSKNPLDPHKLPESVKHTCLGFGIVRAVNLKKRLLYIITPLAYEKLKTVNALLKGCITIPHIFILKQEIPISKLSFHRLVWKNACNELEKFHMS